MIIFAGMLCACIWISRLYDKGWLYMFFVSRFMTVVNTLLYTCNEKKTVSPRCGKLQRQRSCNQWPRRKGGSDADVLLVLPPPPHISCYFSIQRNLYISFSLSRAKFDLYFNFISISINLMLVRSRGPTAHDDRLGFNAFNIYICTYIYI